MGIGISSRIGARIRFCVMGRYVEVWHRWTGPMDSSLDNDLRCPFTFSRYLPVPSTMTTVMKIVGASADGAPLQGCADGCECWSDRCCWGGQCSCWGGVFLSACFCSTKPCSPLRHLRRRIAVARKSVIGRNVRVLN
jgi:hypothetical protein